MHTPVLLKQAIEGLQVIPGGKYIDATAGEGGHLEEIVKAGGNVLGLDQDGEQITRLKQKFESNNQIMLIKANFAGIETVGRRSGFFPVQGVLFDFGLSFGQLQRSGRGFSYKNRQEPLDMRLNTEDITTASDIANTFSEEELYEVLAKNSEEPSSHKIARRIVDERVKNKITTVGDLTEIIEGVLGKNEGVMSRVFQAFRMEVNNEKQAIRKGLEGALRILALGGRMVTITFHSIEDRLVKRFSTQYAGQIKLLELLKGSRGRPFEKSAKLRIMEKLS